jgi:hypothetical protein
MVYGDIKAGMILPPWKKFLGSLLYFVIVRSDHNEVVRINLSFKPILIDLEVERLSSFPSPVAEGRRKTHKKDVKIHLQKYWSPLFGHMFSICLLSDCLCGDPYESLYMSGIDTWEKHDT